MKTFATLAAGLALSLLHFSGNAQPDSAHIAEKAMGYADSLIKADKFQNWSQYADLAPASVLKHYGGKDGYIDRIRAGRKRTTSDIDEDDPVLKMEHLMTYDGTWQFLIQESRYIHKEDKKIHIVTYFLGESKDEGETWKLFDVSYNTVANIIYLMPDVFGDMAIPEPTMLTTDEELARQQAAANQAKKASAKKTK